MCLLESLEPRQLLATYAWDPKNDGSSHTGWYSTNTGDWLQGTFQYPNSNQWTAPQHVSDAFFASPPLRVTTGIGPGNPLYTSAYEIPGPALIDQPGNWNRVDYPDATDADVVIGAGSSVILSGYVNFPFAGSPPLSGAIKVNSLDNAGDLVIHDTGSLGVYGASFTNDGSIQVAGPLVFQNAGTTPLVGSGTIVLTGGSIQRPAQGLGTISLPVTQSIRGSGSISAPISASAGVISADAGSTLTVSVGNGSLANTGTLEATTAGDTVTNSVLSLPSGTIVNTGGTIRAVGNTSRVAVTGATIVGGLLASSGTGVIQVSGGTLDSKTAAITSTAAIDVVGSGASWKGSVSNAGGVSVRATLTFDGGASLGGGGAIKLGNGTVNVVGTGVLTDIDNPISGSGTISGDAGTSLSLQSSLTADGGKLAVSIPVATTATGVLAAANGGTLTITGKVTGMGTIMAGDGSTVDLRNAEIGPATMLVTSGTGVILLSGSIDGSGPGFQTTANVRVTPSAGAATLAVGGSIGNGGVIDVGLETLDVSSDTTLSGGGIIRLAATATVDGAVSGTGTLTNADNTITGVGSIGDGLTAVVNSGTIRAVGAGDSFLLSFFAPVTNTAAGTLETNATGVLGFSTDLINRGTVSAKAFAALGSVTNAAGASFSVTGPSSSVYGAFTNLGTATVATQSDAVFATLSHGATGVQVSASGRIVVTQDFLNTSTQSAAWSTTGATLAFSSIASSASHRLQLAGSDLGTAAAGWTANFAWGGLYIKSGHTVSLESGRGDSGAAAGYFGAVTGAALDAATQSVTNITGNGLNLYYDPAVASNAYLAGKSYALQSGGFLIPKGALGFPTALAASGGSGQASLVWAAPVLAGNPTVTDYVVQYSSNNGSTWTTFSRPGGASTLASATVTGLTNGASYRFRVAAKYAAGTSETSVPTAAIVVGAPNAPTGVAAFPGNGRMTVAWTAPAQNAAAISGYVIEYKAADESGSTSADSVATNGNVFGLTNGKQYVFRVAVKNSFGTGPFSPYTAAVAPTTEPYAPSAPRSVAGTSGDGQVILSWSPPLIDGNASITDYVVQYGTNGTDWTTFDDGTSASTLAFVTPLTNGTAYVFRVAAKNSAGTGVYSTASAAVTPAAVPGLPQSLVATPANGQVTLSWAAPASNGGSPITDYIVRYIGPDGPVVVNDGVSKDPGASVAGLTNGATYFFSIAAVSAVGQGGFTSTVSVTPRTVPAAPTAVAGTPAGGRVNLTWSQPASNGGAMITDYLVEYRRSSDSSWTTFAHAPSSAPFITVNGLADGTSYVFRVSAVNAAGTGPASSISAAVVPKAVPGIPLDVIGTPGNAQVSLSWAAPTDPGASAITDYRVEYSSNNGSTWTTFSHVAFTSSACAVTGLTNGTAYVFRVAAVNALGTGGYSPVSLPVTPRTVPNAPTAVTATAGNKQVALSWSAPAVTGGAAIVDYLVQYSTDNGTNWTTFDDGTASSVGATVNGLTNGAAYVFRVAAVNAAGQGAFTAKSAAATPRDVPGVPAGVSATPDNGRVTLVWTAPSEAGASDISDYAVQYSSNGGGTWTTFKDAVSPATSTAVTGLTNGTSYLFRVAAVNSLGTGLYSAASSAATPRTLPNAPTAVKTTVGTGLVTLAWSAPAITGGAAIVDYVVQQSSDGGKTWVTSADGVSAATTAIVGGLTNDTAYIFRVAAVNVAGQGAFSANTAAATPRLLPAAPSTPAGVSGNAQVSLTWAAPAAPPGQTISDYAVQVSTDNGVTWKDYADGKSASPAATVKSLTNGTSYRFRVAAITSVGTGAYSSASSSVTPKTTPAAPTALVGSLVKGQVTLNWKAPTSTGGAAISGYAVQYSSNGGTTWSDAPGGNVASTTTTVTGLVNGTSYVFRVAAVNEVGIGAFTAKSTPLTPKAPIDPAVYQGTYAGTFTGAKAFGTIDATISGTSITVNIIVTAPGTQITNAPASGTGTIAADGSFSVAAQGAIFGATYVGQIVVGQNGQVTANGTWKYSTIASGTWQVSRIPSGV